MTSRFFQSQAGSALISTMLVIVVLTIIVVAFLQSMTVERQTARSYLNRYRAELAAQAGLQAFMASLARLPPTTQGVVAKADPSNEASPLELEFIRSPTALDPTPSDGTREIIPLISHKNELRIRVVDNSAAQLKEEVEKILSEAGDKKMDVNRLRDGHYAITSAPAPGSTIPSAHYAPFVTVDGTGTSNSNLETRYAYVATDLSSTLNLTRYGLTYKAEEKRRKDTFPEEIAITGISADAFLSAMEAAAVQSRSDQVPWNDTLAGQLFTDRASYEKKRFLYSFHDGRVHEFVPAGFFDKKPDGTYEWTAYADGGKAKSNLNDLAISAQYGSSATDRAVNIATLIDMNLPEFKKRDASFTEVTTLPNPGQSFPSEQIRYVRRIAASIVDYIDTDTTCTRLPDGEPAGKDMFPYPTKIVEKYEIVSVTGAAGGPRSVNMRHTVFVELWNPYLSPSEDEPAKELSGQFKMELKTMRQISAGPGAVMTNMDPVIGEFSVTLKPNEFRVYNLGETTQTLTTGSTGNVSVKLEVASNGDSDPTKQATRFKAYWDGELMDWTPNESPLFDPSGPGLERLSATMTESSRIAWAVSIQQMVNATVGGKAIRRAVGDPRQNYISNYLWRAASKTNANLLWNGRGSWGISSQFCQDYQNLWAQRDAIPRGPKLGVTVAATADPTSALPVVAEPKDAPFYIRNAAMKNVAELGNIYDPAHVNDRDPSLPNTTGIPTHGGDPDSLFSSGGARTLRIGQPETANVDPANTATSWDSDKRRATRLLDLFTVLPVDTSGIPAAKDTININTASREALLALFVNLVPQTDKTAAEKATPPFLTEDGAGAIADEVINGRPYFSQADFHRFTKSLNDPQNYEAVFPPVVPASTPPKIELNTFDRTREEILRRCYDTLAVTSSMFRVVIYGQAIPPGTGAPTEVSLEAIVELRLEKQSDGTLKHVPYIIQQQFL